MSSYEERKAARRESFQKDKEYKEKGGSGFGRRSFLKPDSELEKMGIKSFYPISNEDGSEKQYRLHLLPSNPKDPDLLAFRIFGHYSVGPNDDAFLCPKWMKEYLTSIGVEVPEAIRNGKCPICDEHDKLLTEYKNTKTKMSEEERKDFYAKIRECQPHTHGFDNPKPKRMLSFVVDGTTEDSEKEGIRVFLMPVSIYEEGIIEQSEDADSGYVDLVDPIEGYYFYFKRSGKKMEDTDYTGFKIKERKRNLLETTDWMDRIPSFMDVLQFVSYEEIKEVFEGVVDEVKTENAVVEGEKSVEAKNEVQESGKAPTFEPDDELEKKEETKVNINDEEQKKMDELRDRIRRRRENIKEEKA